MRRLRSRSFVPFLLVTSLAACSGNQQGYYGPCDEPAGFAVGCPGIDESPEDGAVENAWDACMKLATCGVIHTQVEDDSNAADFDDCLAQVQAAMGADQGATVLLCIEDASCPDLAAATDDDGNPSQNVERVLGWCGRLHPTGP